MPENLFKTGIRPLIDQYIQTKREAVRDYGEYWSASSAGYCQRKVIFERLKVPYTSEDARKQRLFSAGETFHQWIQGLTKASGLSIGQEVELQDDGLMVRGHIDDLIVINGKQILYDYKSANSRSFTYAKDRPISHYHKMQLGTYMYMLRQREKFHGVAKLTEARVMSISKDDLRLAEKQLIWSPVLEKEVVGYWRTLNGYWKRVKIPACTCHKYEGGFMAREQYNPYFYKGEPCSLKWYALKINQLRE